jgi:AbrB family looped-hinge helix DNA binding protein
MKQTNLTIKGQVTIPKDVRDALGLRPGQPVEFAWNDRGEAVIRAGIATEADQTRRYEQAHAAIAAVADRFARFRSGRSTDDIMRDLRGDDPYPP